MAIAQRAVWRKRGCGSADTERVASTFALVRTFPLPPPAGQAAGALCASGRQRSGTMKRENER
jgi:hypothetical protein